MAIITYLVVFLVMLKNESALWHDVARTGLVAINGPLIIDYLGQVSRYCCLLVGLLITLVASRAGSERLATEVLGTIMMLVAGLMLVCRANELVFLFVALELISIPTYVLLFLGRDDRASGEATIKYFFLSILASALLLYGMSFLYGVARGHDPHLGYGGRAGNPRGHRASAGSAGESVPDLVGDDRVRAGVQDRCGAVSFLRSRCLPRDDQHQCRVIGRCAEGGRHPRADTPGDGHRAGRFDTGLAADVGARHRHDDVGQCLCAVADRTCADSWRFRPLPTRVTC